MNRAYIVLTVWVVIISGMLPLIAQSNAGGVVPRLVNYCGKAVDAQGKTLMGVAGVTFAPAVVGNSERAGGRES